MFVHLHLLHSCIAADELLPQVGDVVVELLHVLLKVFPEGQKGLLHLALELLDKNNKQKLNTAGEDDDNELA